MRTNTNLFCEGTSPLLKRLELQKRAGIKLTAREQQRLNETVSMVQIPKNRKQNVPQKIQSKPEDSIDLEEVLREMGYGEDDDLRAHPTDEMEEVDEVGSMSRDELKQMIQDIVLDTMKEEDDLNEIIDNLTRNDKII
jgi:DNA-directed RNA polymerase alpha subunit